MRLVATLCVIAALLGSAPEAHARRHRRVAEVPQGPVFDHSAFDLILRESVSDGLVDYAHIRTARAHELDAYLARLSAADVTKLLRNERLAFYINLYNATMIRAVLDHNAPDWTPADDGGKVFDEPRVHLGDSTLSLNQLEKTILIRRFREPRVHTALVCAARSCPPLLPRAYRGRDLVRVLAANMKQFLADTSFNKIDTAAHTLRLSPIFKWYADDFAGLGGVPAFAGRTLERNFAGWKLEYLDYDWKLNAQEGRR